MSIKIGFRTDVGRKRKANQDSYVVLPGDQLGGGFDSLLLVADGMGGRRGGEIASSIVAQVVPESIKAAIKARNGSGNPLETQKMLIEAISLADKSVQAKQTEVAELSGMGTTLVVATISGAELTLAHVGDSRAYLLREGALKQLTDDHSEVWEQVKAGNMTPEEAQHSRFRNIISRAIGTINPMPDVQKVELQQGDSLLICSDGLTTEVEDSEIARIFAGTPEIQTACDLLVKTALELGGRDNITVVGMRFGDFSPVELPRKTRTRHGDSWHDLPLAPERSWDFEEEEAAASAAAIARYKNSPILLVILFLTSVLCLTLAYALFSIWQKLPAKQESTLPPIASPALKLTDKNLLYSEAAPIFNLPIRETPLAIDRDGKPIVMTKDGKLVFIEEGKAVPLPNQIVYPAQSNTVFKPSRSPIVATDASGNRYQFNPNAPSPTIEKFNPEGARTNPAVGGKKLKRVTALAVDESGNVFAIENQALYEITATEKP